MNEELILTKLAIICHLLDSASQVMKELAELCEESDVGTIDKLIEQQSAEGLEMFAKFLNDLND